MLIQIHWSCFLVCSLWTVCVYPSEYKSTLVLNRAASYVRRSHVVIFIHSSFSTFQGGQPHKHASITYICKASLWKYVGQVHMFVTFTHMEGRDLGSIYTVQKFKFRKTAISIRLVYHELTFWYTTKCKYHLVKRTILQSHRRVINMSLNKSSHKNGLLKTNTMVIGSI